VAVSLDSVDPAVHDRFRGVAGAWAAAVSGIDELRRAGLAVQLNTTVGRWNVDRLDEIVAFGIDREIRDFQCFFLVPTGRGRDLDDLSTEEYETAIERLLELGDRSGVHLRPTCAPQVVRIAERMGLGRGPWTRGCLAGISYCRIDPAGTVTPCPYLPLALGNVLERPFGEIWRDSPVLAALRDADALGGRCGRCGYRVACRGCRARAYGAGRPGDGCGLRGVESAGPAGWLGEDRACSYDPATSATEGMP
jgi:radical SAM protein with 4Fe4S-binding SPASM domain